MSQSKHVQFAATALALAMSAAASAQTANVELAGQLGISITHKNNQTGGGSLNDVGDNTLAGSWFRISGSENLGGGMRVLFRLESSVALDTGNSGAPAAGKFFNRQAWIGLETGRSGAITVGRQFHAATDRAIRSFDVFNLAGSNLHVTPLALFGVNRYGTAPANDSRVDNSIKYRVGVPGVVDAAVSYGLGEVAGNGTLGKSYSGEISSTTKMYSVGALAYRVNAPAAIAATGAVPRHTTWGVGGNVTFGTIRPYLAWYDTKLDNTTAGRLTQTNKILHVGVSWRGLGATTLSGGYYHDKGTSLNGIAGRNGVKDTIVLGADYAMSKRTSLTAAAFKNSFKDGYMLEAVNIAGLGRNPTASSVTGFSLGMRHSF